ncbi:dephospho-CoA kinase [Mangrovimonas yunxiaonensis]|uniref:Dephospho-CoA kinase n=1 Tax=Mangrovimonas yunxiaonensis TaxID=1197477 RepID=A0A084TN50_9FLAO|nr:dephospho-CoA kinase [Mangrovimonas yunxiaonensis]KFB02136.1 dephospho-CoA kinase [Mangrovimonas yunxiaonensis]GGH47714.1 dephospho-CoA kinase [Mangrovimonas yunxiaonensis]
MIIVGITGGIGSGKTTVAKMFNKHFGIPLYLADTEAKTLMQTSKPIKEELTALFGEAAYINGVLNRTYLAEQIFSDKSKLEKMNAIIHPRVAQHFLDWANQQHAPYVLKEAAILFESGSYKQCDFIITVTAPLKVRIARLLERDETTEEKIMTIIENQWSDERKIARSDFVINNLTIKETEAQVVETHAKILTLIE